MTSTLLEKFIQYVQIDTQSNPNSSTYPSTEAQKNLGNLLVEQLRFLGIENAHLDEFGYVYAMLPSNSAKKIPTICLCSHIDTSPDCNATNVRPIVHKNYDGQPIVLPDDVSKKITIEDFPYLKEKIGQTIITASGKTLLGADDKAGIAIIMQLIQALQANPEQPHGAISILFTPDEEIGRGTEKLDFKKINAAFAYTLDGGEVGTLEDETFNAAMVIISITGVNAHPGAAKGKMVNAIKIISAIVDRLPNTIAPEMTDGRAGFIHPTTMEGTAEKASLQCIVRDFDKKLLAEHIHILKAIVEAVCEKFPKAIAQFDVKEQYQNMVEIVKQYPNLVDFAIQAYQRAGIKKIIKEPIRGGTDGSKLSFAGLPCPNLFTGMQGIHSEREWICLEDMEKAVECLLHLVDIWVENA